MSWRCSADETLFIRVVLGNIAVYIGRGRDVVHFTLDSILHPRCRGGLARVSLAVITADVWHYQSEQVIVHSAMRPRTIKNKIELNR